MCTRVNETAGRGGRSQQISRSMRSTPRRPLKSVYRSCRKVTWTLYIYLYIYIRAWIYAQFLILNGPILNSDIYIYIYVGMTCNSHRTMTAITIWYSRYLRFSRLCERVAARLQQTYGLTLSRGGSMRKPVFDPRLESNRTILKILRTKK